MQTKQTRKKKKKKEDTTLKAAIVPVCIPRKLKNYHLNVKLKLKVSLPKLNIYKTKLINAISNLKNETTDFEQFESKLNSILPLTKKKILCNW